MSKKLVLINTLPTSKILARAIEAYWFVDKGFDVHFWDCSSLFWDKAKLDEYYSGADDYKYKGPNHIEFKSRAELKKSILELDDTSIYYLSRTIYKFVDDDWVLKLIQDKKLGLIFKQFESEPIPNTVSGKLKWNLILLKHRILNRDIRPTTFLGSGSQLRNLVKKFYPNTKYISLATPRMDWNKKEKLIDDEYIVFVDESIEHAPDAKLLGYEVSIDVEGYYKRMRELFNLIEKTLGIPIVIGASGKYKYIEDRFGGRTLFYGKTFALIEHSKLVVGHFSTALDQAVISRKPILQIDDESFTKEKRMDTEYTTNITGKSLIMSDNVTKQDIIDSLKVDYVHYENVEKLYFKEKNVYEDYKEVLADIISQYKAN